MTNAFDVIVVGTRCAGSPTAMLLARKGYRVLAVDRATFPSDTISTHMVHPLAVRSLAHADLAVDDPQAAIGQFRQALTLLREVGEPARVAETLTNLSCVLIEQGRVDECRPLLAEALVVGERRPAALVDENSVRQFGEGCTGGLRHRRLHLWSVTR